MEYNKCAMGWILAPDDSVATNESPLSDLLMLTVENILHNMQSSNKELSESFKITFEQMKLVEENTRQQRNSSLWLQLRENRITASNFGAVLSAIKRQHHTETLFNRLKGFAVYVKH